MNRFRTCSWLSYFHARINEDYSRHRGWEDCSDEERDSVIDGIRAGLEWAWNQGGLRRDVRFLARVSGRYFPADRHGPAEHPDIEVKGVEPDEYDVLVPGSGVFAPEWLSGDGMRRLAVVLQTVPHAELQNARESFRHEQQLDGDLSFTGTVVLVPTRATVEGDGVRIMMDIQAGRSQQY